MNLSQTEKLEFFKQLAHEARIVGIPKELMLKVVDETAGLTRLEDIIKKIYLTLENYKLDKRITTLIIERTIKVREDALFNKSETVVVKPEVKTETFVIRPELYGPPVPPKKVVIDKPLLYGPPKPPKKEEVVIDKPLLYGPPLPSKEVIEEIHEVPVLYGPYTPPTVIRYSDDRQVLYGPAPVPKYEEVSYDLDDMFKKADETTEKKGNPKK